MMKSKTTENITCRKCGKSVEQGLELILAQAGIAGVSGFVELGEALFFLRMAVSAKLHRHRQEQCLSAKKENPIK